MNAFETSLRELIADTPVIDPHSHLHPDHPQARTLADLVLYHHVWIELVSAGMPATATSAAGLPHEVADPRMDPLDRVRAALPYLPHLRNTTLGHFLRTLLQDLYDVPGGELTGDSLAEVADRVAAAADSPSRAVEVLREHCGIIKTLTVEGSGRPPVTDVIGRGREGVPTNLLSGKQTPRQVLEGMTRSLGAEVHTADDYATAMRKLGTERGQSNLLFVGVWVLPSLTVREPRPGEVNAILRRAWEGDEITPEEAGLVCGFALGHFLEGMRQGHLRTVQLIVGAEVLPPHRSVTQWRPELPGGLARLAGAFEDFQFNCSTASDLFTQDLGIVAKHVPNVSVAGYWWHTLYPHTIRKSLETRLDMIPANKIIAFFSDAYHAEWCAPKLKLVKQILGDVLLERVQRGWMTEEIARSLVAPLLHENAARIYNVSP
ncbi:MAG: hypothetical protein KKI08_00290 [Armatimonadetes bacterium]|nr:hypothetical protein [Armatimonadota bacterium]